MSAYMDTAVPTAPQPTRHPAPPRGIATALLSVSDALDLSQPDAFLRRGRVMAINCRCIIVDLSRVRYVDSGGVRALLQLAEELELDRKELRVVIQPGSRVERTLSLLQLLQRLQAFPSLKQAWSGVWHTTV
ncbi:MAG: STAS domain-containing protein [Actinomycetota bacterium]